MRDIFVFAGTSEGRELVETILKTPKYRCTVSVVSEYGAKLLPKSKRLTILQGRMDCDQMVKAISAKDYLCVVDATHPYALTVTKEIKKACDLANYEYLRLERKTDEKLTTLYDPTISYFENISEAADWLESQSEKIFVTTGSKELPTLSQKISDKSRLFVRVLPSIESIKVCNDCKIIQKQIIAMQGPFSTQMNKIQFEESGAKILLTKETGLNGGFYEKIEAAKDLGIKIAVIKNPERTSKIGSISDKALENSKIFHSVSDVLKKLLLSVAIAVIVSPSLLYSEMKNNTSVTLGVTPTNKDETDHVKYDGAYALMESTMSDDYTTVGGKLYYRLSSAENTDEEAQKLDVKKAYIKIRPFGNNVLEGAIGKLYSYYLPGGYFSLTETYTGASRWGKTGVGAKSEIYGFTFGAALPVTESSVTFKKDWGEAGSIGYDFSFLSKDLPLFFGFDVIYGATYDGDSNVNNVSKNDFSECVALNFSKKNLAFFKAFSVFAAFSHNAEPYVSSSVFKPVTNYANKEMKKSDIFSVAFRPTIGRVKITSETEIGHSTEGNMVPFYSALQIYFPIYGIISFKPMAGYYAAYDMCDSSKSFDTWEFYPRAVLEFEKVTITGGWDMFYKEITDGEYRWIWSVPLTAKIKIGK